MYKYKKKLTLILLVICLGFMALLVRLGYIYFNMSNDINQKAFDLWSRDIPIEGQRGNIYDRKGRLIVGNKLAPSVAIIKRQIEDKNQVASFLSEVLDCSYEAIANHIDKNVSVELIKPEGRKISTKQANRIMKENIPGVYVVGDTVRYYPYGDLLSQVLGFTGIDNQGIAGIEYIYDGYLKGTEGALKIFTDAKGNIMHDMYGLYESSNPGFDIYLTIDLEIQEIIENTINNAIKQYDPDQMLILVQSPKTGEILGMASYPNFYPENYQDYSQEIYNRNLPIWMSYEPGSTFKIVTYSAGLEEQVFTLDEGFYCPGYRMVAGARIKDWKAGGHGSETFLEVIQNSCNPGFMEIGERLGKERLFKYIKDFGFGEKTGIDLLGESKGIVFNVENVGPVELATSSFGQGNSVTPIQLTTAASAAINGGDLMQPYILKNVSVSGNVIYEGKALKKRSVISKETSNLVCFALENVVARGTGRGAYVDGYRIGGKTGTAQKVGANGGYLANNYILSFLGAAPMNDPLVVVYLAIDNPKNTVQYGGVVAAPLVGSIMAEILPILGVKKQFESQIEKEYRYYIDLKHVTVLDYVGTKVSSLKHHQYYTFQIIGDGDTIIAQSPAKNERVTEGSTIILYTN